MAFFKIIFESDTVDGLKELLSIQDLSSGNSEAFTTGITAPPEMQDDLHDLLGADMDFSATVPPPMDQETDLVFDFIDMVIGPPDGEQEYINLFDEEIPAPPNVEDIDSMAIKTDDLGPPSESSAKAAKKRK